jgi:hypothetical protein
VILQFDLSGPCLTPRNHPNPPREREWEWEVANRQWSKQELEPTSGDRSAPAATGTWCRTSWGGRSQSSGTRCLGRGSLGTRTAGRHRPTPISRRTSRTLPAPPFGEPPPRPPLRLRRRWTPRRPRASWAPLLAPV